MKVALFFFFFPSLSPSTSPPSFFFFFFLLRLCELSAPLPTPLSPRGKAPAFSAPPAPPLPARGRCSAAAGRLLAALPPPFSLPAAGAAPRRSSRLLRGAGCPPPGPRRRPAAPSSRRSGGSARFARGCCPQLPARRLTPPPPPPPSPHRTSLRCSLRGHLQQAGFPLSASHRGGRNKELSPSRPARPALPRAGAGRAPRAVPDGGRFSSSPARFHADGRAAAARFPPAAPHRRLKKTWDGDGPARAAGDPSPLQVRGGTHPPATGLRAGTAAQRSLPSARARRGPPAPGLGAGEERGCPGWPCALGQLGLGRSCAEFPGFKAPGPGAPAASCASPLPRSPSRRAGSGRRRSTSCPGAAASPPGSCPPAAAAAACRIPGRPGGDMVPSLAPCWRP